MIYATLDAVTRRMRVVNAGHPGALLFPAAHGNEVELSATGPALGLMDAARFTSTDISVPARSVLVAYTDGVVEALDGSDLEFGVARASTRTMSRRWSSRKLRHDPRAFGRR
jgi:phosphoserine phosphatase RsbU/P